MSIRIRMPRLHTSSADILLVGCMKFLHILRDSIILPYTFRFSFTADQLFHKIGSKHILGTVVASTYRICTRTVPRIIRGVNMVHLVLATCLTLSKETDCSSLMQPMQYVSLAKFISYVYM